MKAIVCIDKNNGILFNCRRLSKDRYLIKHIIKELNGKKLYITNFSKDLFEEYSDNVEIDDSFIDKINEDEYCFIEEIDINRIINKVDTLITYNWNRDYPADVYLDVNLDNWILEYNKEIKGYSHDSIIESCYRRKRDEN